jgi:hypothetical protein
MKFVDTWMLNVADEKKRFPVATISGYWYRLIPSRFPTIDIYRRVAPPERWPLAAAVETLTNPRVRLRDKFSGSAPPGKGSKFQNWNHAPYAYPNPSGSRFLSSEFGVLELSDTVQTALAASIRRREAFLADANLPAVDLEMRVLRHEVHGIFVDLRSLPLDLPQAERWSLGTRLLEEGAQGVAFLCPERPSATAITVFNADCLGRAIQTQHFKFRWDGVQITQLYDFREESDGRPILAEQVFTGDKLPFLPAETRNG